MSRLNDLMARVQSIDPSLASDLMREIRADQPNFGLVFEKHQPEMVQLPGRPVRPGDKVMFLPPRQAADPAVGDEGSDDSAAERARVDRRLWRVRSISKSDPVRVAKLSLIAGIDAEPETTEASIDEIVVIAEFTDPIYPGMVSTGRVDNGGDKPVHTVINAENFHALKTLTYTHAGKIDAIYIDPPYNKGTKDWKYSNRFVDSEDIYLHSKWLSFMERRLKLAKELLNPDDSVLIVTIDEAEYLHLGLLLEQVFPEASIQMVTSVISAKGVARAGRFSRVEEYVYFLSFGEARVSNWTTSMLGEPVDPSKKKKLVDEEEEQDELLEPVGEPIEYLGFRRREPSAIRGARKNQFFPVFVDPEKGVISGVGEAIADDIDASTVPVPEGQVAVFPRRGDGREGIWGLTPDVARRNWKKGYLRVNWNKKQSKGTVYYLPGGTIDQIESGEAVITGHSWDGSVQGYVLPESETERPKQVWHLKSHNAETYGTKIITSLLPGRRFPYPKSLFAVEDSLRYFLARKPEAVVLDFFAGSGTTAHAVMRLNRQDDGRRQSISVTNNEVSDKEAIEMRSRGLRPGDEEWEALGICDYITKPRIKAAITGRTPSDQPVKGSYKFTDVFRMSEGFEENAEFFTLTYETPLSISHNRAFERIAPLLWMKAGGQGRRIDAIPEEGWAVVDRYGILFDLDASETFCSAIEEIEGKRYAYVITNEERRYQTIVQRLPDDVEVVRLYESYLTNFQFVEGD